MKTVAIVVMLLTLTALRVEYVTHAYKVSQLTHTPYVQVIGDRNLIELLGGN